MRHKIRQVIALKKMTLQSGLKLLKDSREKIVSTACTCTNFNYKLAHSACIKASESCIKKGLLPLRMKGYQLAVSLQNPFLSLIPKSGLAFKVR